MKTQRGEGEVRARRALEDAFMRQNAILSCLAFAGDGFGFCRDPAQYEWRCIGTREMLVPRSCSLALPVTPQPPPVSRGDSICWEKHQVWIVEGALRRGESNMLVRRRFYVDAESWIVLLGEGYDPSGALVMHYVGAVESENGCWYSI